VLNAFSDLGVPTFSSDEAVHALYGCEAVPVVEAAFPGVTVNERIDREALSKILIAAPERIKELEALVHPMVREKIAQFLEKSAKAKAPLAVVDIPLLFETGYDYGLDSVALTVCDPAIQRERALARPGMTVEKLETILARQMPQDEKRKRATYLFDTSGKLEATRKMVKALVDAIKAAQPR
jgi:dephospho-CoA kinase